MRQRQEPPGYVLVAICKMMALGHTPPIMVQEIKNDFGISISRQCVYGYCRQNRFKRIARRMLERMRNRVKENPLSSPTVRLEYLRKALNSALKGSNNDLKRIREVAMITKEAKEEIALIMGKSINSTEVKISLLQIVKEATNGNTDRTSESRPRSAVLSAESDTVDSQVIGDLQVL